MAEPTLEQWRDRLLAELSGRQGDIAKRRRYFDGDHPFPTAPDDTTEVFRRLAELGVTNLLELVVNAVCDGLIVRDIRVSTDEEENLRVWREVWQRNSLDADSGMVHEEALKVGRSFVLTWPDPDDPDGVSITPEDPADVIVAYKAGSRRERVAALKRWRLDPLDPTSDEMVTVWTPTEVKTWGRESSDKPWGEYLDYGTGVNPLGVVPIVEFPCRPAINGKVKPEISDSAIKLQDRINKTGFDCVVAGEFGAFPQRYTIGVEIPTKIVKNADGEDVAVPQNPLKAGPQRVFALRAMKDQQASIGQLPAYPTSDLLKQIETWTMQLASSTQTPVFHLFSGASNIGAEFIERIEAAHHAKVRRHQVVFGERWSEVIALALRAKGIEPPDDIEVGWMPPVAAPVERADMASKYAAAGLSPQYIARQLGETPSEIERGVGDMPARDETPVVA